MKVTQLNKTYDRRTAAAHQVLRDVSFTLPETGFVCILGPSGCGKTSLLNAIGGLDRFDSGEISLGDVTVKGYGTAAYEAERNRSFGYIFQNYYLLQNHSVGYNVYLGLHSLDLSHGEKLRRVRDALTAVDMDRYIRRKVSELSGGQQQRVAIARALARRPRMIFADEPTGNLDESNTVNICTLLRQISRNSLVVMVTHEERIAEFFADRIIRLEDGRIASDSASWDRNGLAPGEGAVLYAGDYREERMDADGISLRILGQEGAAPVKLTVVALKDRVIIKLDDTRTVSCGGTREAPVLEEGKRPVMTLEELDRDEELPLFGGGQDPQGRAGQGLSLPMMLSEVRELTRGKSKSRLAAWFFMVLLTVLSVWMVGDYLTLKSVDPRDFVVTDSHILEIILERGEDHEIDETGNMQATQLRGTVREYIEEFTARKDGFELLPFVSNTPVLSSEWNFPQMEDAAIKFREFSYVPLDYLSESSLIMGRMPENTGEIVVDRWILDAVLLEDGILQNSISDISFFLNKSISFPKTGYTATIVGISDDGEAALYASRSVIASLSVGSKLFMTLSELQALYPGEFDHLTLADDECFTVRTKGVAQNRPGQPLSFNVELKLTVAEELLVDTYATVIVPDSRLDSIIRSQAVMSRRFSLYCPDKEAVKASVTQEPPTQVRDNKLQQRLMDRYSDGWNTYTAASSMKADARTIVTVTVMAAAAVMLYLLRRTQVHGRIEMLAVYRLLGIPGGKLAVLFAMESGYMFLTGSLPAAGITWLVMTVLTNVEDLAFFMILPWQAAAAVAAVILAYHLAVSLIPLARLLALPPAQLASKYDL